VSPHVEVWFQGLGLNFLGVNLKVWFSFKVGLLWVHMARFSFRV
jgi:hypothetical protein